jgi:SAM-dependent methyltransferase
MKFQESILAHKYLDNLRGIEIGGSAHNPFNLPDCINVDFTNSMNTVWKNAEFGYCGEKMKVDVVADASHLPFKDKSLDYVISSHMIEHIFDPIGALKEWLRVIKRGGFIFSIVPFKDAIPEETRPLTTIEELIDRHEKKFKLDIKEFLGSLVGGHFTVFDLPLFLDICDFLDLKIVEKHEHDDKVGNGFCVINQK